MILLIAVGNVDDMWQQIGSIFNETSSETLGMVKSRPERVWLCAATWQLFDERRKLKAKKKESEANTKHYN